MNKEIKQKLFGASIIAASLGGNHGCARPDTNHELPNKIDSITRLTTTEHKLEMSSQDDRIVRGILKNSTYIPPMLEGISLDDEGKAQKMSRDAAITTKTVEEATTLVRILNKAGCNVATYTNKGDLQKVFFSSKENLENGYVGNIMVTQLNESLPRHAAHEFELRFGADLKLDPYAEFIAKAEAKPKKDAEITELLKKGFYEPNNTITFPSLEYTGDADRLASKLEECGYHNSRDESADGKIPNIILDDSQAEQFKKEYGAYLNVGDEFRQSVETIKRAKAHVR